MSDPGKDLAHDACFLQEHIKTRLSIAIMLADIAIAIGCSTQDAHGTTLSRMTFATTAPLQDFRSLIFRDHALNLQEQLIFRCLANFPVEKIDLDSRSQKLFK